MIRARKHAAEFTRCPCGLIMRIGALCPDCAREPMQWPEYGDAARRERALTVAVAISFGVALLFTYALGGCG